MRLPIAWAGLLTIAIAGNVFGWGREGHRLVAEIAERRLDHRTRVEIAALLGPGESLQSIAAWADEVRPNRRETSTWHYINIPTSAPRGDHKQYCPATGCVVDILPQLAAKLKDRTLPRQERYEALKFLVHFVGDMHQPLHGADQGDRGGNDVQAVFQNRPTNLHSVWDTPMIELAFSRNPELRVRWGEGPGKREAKKMKRGGPGDWIWDSQAAAKEFVYQGLPAARPAVIDDAYVQRALPVIQLQIQRAGVRLAEMLNGALAR